MSLSELSKALKAMYVTPLTEMVQDCHSIGVFLQTRRMTFTQAVARSATGRVRRLAWDKEFHNCDNTYLHYSQVGDLDKACDDWIPERDVHSMFAYPLQL
jgi:hypothetical protein